MQKANFFTRLTVKINKSHKSAFIFRCFVPLCNPSCRLYNLAAYFLERTRAQVTHIK